MKRFLFVIFIVLCVAASGLSVLSWKIDPSSGQLGTTVTGKTGLAGYDLVAGDAIFYDYETNVQCNFIITTDPLNPAIGEKLNISGTHNSGWFHCPVAGRYVIQVFFAQVPEEGLAEIAREFYAIDDTSRVIMVAKPVALAVMTAALGAMVIVTQRRAKPFGIPSYWEFFSSRTGNWVAILAGGVILVAASVIESANLLGSRQELIQWLGSNVLGLGLIMGLVLTWTAFRADTKAARRI